MVVEGRGGDNYPVNDKQTAKKNNVKALKSPKTSIVLKQEILLRDFNIMFGNLDKNQTGKEPSHNYDSGDGEISEPKIMEEKTKPRIARRRGVKNTTENAGKTRVGRKLASEASISIDKEAASRKLDKNGPDGASKL